jgi:hypothetical protein
VFVFPLVAGAGVFVNFADESPRALPAGLAVPAAKADALADATGGSYEGTSLREQAAPPMVAPRETRAARRNRRSRRDDGRGERGEGRTTMANAAYFFW